MRQNYNTQTQSYGGLLVYGATSSFPFLVAIPLYIRTIDLPIRKPKITEVNTIPTADEAGVSDWSTHALFMGGQGLLETTLEGFFLTPTSKVTDAHGVSYQQLDPTNDGEATGTSLGLPGYSYGDIIWAYLDGTLNNISSRFIRTDPTAFIDPFGNTYDSVVIQQFQCDYTVSVTKQTFSMTLYLEV